MGAAKRQMELEFERGWSSRGGHVCAGCLNDPALKKVISDSAQDDEECTFCGESPAVELDILIEAFVGGLKTDREPRRPCVDHSNLDRTPGSLAVNSAQQHAFLAIDHGQDGGR